MAYLDPALLLTLTPLLRGLPGVSCPKAAALLEELSYDVMMTPNQRINVGGKELHSRDFDELFADGPDHRPRVTPAGARLLVELYQLGALPMKPGTWGKTANQVVLDYIEAEQRLVKESEALVPTAPKRGRGRAVTRPQAPSQPAVAGFEPLVTLFFASTARP